MENFKVAFASDDGESFVDRHFGDAYYFYIYSFSDNGIEFLKRIENTTDEDSKEKHGDPKKAKGILGLLKSQDVKVFVSKIFGPNIKRMKKNFVCVLINNDKISDSFNILQRNIEAIDREWKKGVDRDFIDLRKAK